MSLQAMMLQQMDEEFGIGDLVEQEFGTKKSYGSRDLTGLRVEHAQENFSEGKTVILTLKDKGEWVSNRVQHYLVYTPCKYCSRMNASTPL